MKPLTLFQYQAMLINPDHTAQNIAHDDCLDWLPHEKVLRLKSLTDAARRKGINVDFTDRYYPSAKDLDRKKWELEPDDDGQLYRPIPVGELDTDNNIYLNMKEIGYVSSFFTLMHLYGHRVQHEIMTQQPDSDAGKHYAAITKYVGWEKPLNMDDVYADYRLNTGRPDADYAADFLVFEKEAFAFGLDLLQDAKIEIDDKLQYAINTYIVTDFEELKYWWQNKPNKDGDEFNGRFEELYLSYKDNQDFIAQHYPPIAPKTSPFESFTTKGSGVVVIRNNNDYTL